MTLGRRIRRSVALAFSGGSEAAPRVAARGEGPVAATIERIAAENGIPVHRDPLLADALHRFPEGDPIPAELYQAVAEVYAFLIETRRLVLQGKIFPGSDGDGEKNLPVGGVNAFVPGEKSGANPVWEGRLAQEHQGTIFATSEGSGGID